MDGTTNDLNVFHMMAAEWDSLKRRVAVKEAPDLVTAFLETTPVRELDAPARQLGAGDAIDAEVIDAGDDGEVV